MIVVVMAVMFMKVIVSIYCIHWLGGIIRCGYGCGHVMFVQVMIMSFVCDFLF